MSGRSLTRNLRLRASEDDGVVRRDPVYFTVRQKIAMAEEGRVRPIWQKAVALASLALWFTVGASGRWIGFSG